MSLEDHEKRIQRLEKQNEEVSSALKLKEELLILYAGYILDWGKMLADLKNEMLFLFRRQKDLVYPAGGKEAEAFLDKIVRVEQGLEGFEHELVKMEARLKKFFPPDAPPAS